MKNYFSQKQNTITAGSLLVALGIIYGDIGTSPLYVFKAIIGNRSIDETLVYGGISCIFWTLAIQTTLKYIWLTLKADNDGEGGIFSLYALVRRYGKWLVIPTIIGATTLLADGIITPPISVASAVEGLTMVEGLQELPTVTIVIIILSFLFFFQRFGTQKVGFAFGPIMVVWFLMLFVLGLNQLLKHPQILMALNPVYAYELLVHYPHGFWLLGAVFLATTGAEALYSDLGHCGKKNIRITWAFVKICLLINYMGQASWVLTQGNDFLQDRNPFYQIMPSWFLISGVVIATAATIIASQALISGSYTLISEAMNLNFWPRVAVRQPSETKGQVYIPSVNLILWLGCIMMILYFRTSSHMEAAYGFSITLAMMMTTILLSFFLLYKLKWNKWFVIILLLVFSTVELSFFVANIAKIKERWMFLFFELFIFLVMYVWFFARKINNRFTRFVDLGKYALSIKQLAQDEGIQKYASHLVYLTKADSRNEVEEKIIKSIFAPKLKRAEVYWLIHINRTEQPYGLSYSINELVDQCLFKIEINTGFRVMPKTELFFKKILQEMTHSGELYFKTNTTTNNRYPIEPDIRFVFIEKFLSVENEFTLKDSLLLNGFFFLKNLGQSDAKAFGIDKGNIETEFSPLVYHPVSSEILIRIQS
ncbi:KUP/HAK/KT family potassium transporter [Sediminibacterium sp. KACHI17]|uniref:KUP/HAK/KT family potassium transporter n=1 Tax=Sediminibacterium sp. KACHI17 TaxID=1751071 RepID=A0AAT9GK69_9BACT